MNIANTSFPLCVRHKRLAPSLSHLSRHLIAMHTPTTHDISSSELSQDYVLPEGLTHESAGQGGRGKKRKNHHAGQMILNGAGARELDSTDLCSPRHRHASHASSSSNTDMATPLPATLHHHNIPSSDSLHHSKKKRRIHNEWKNTVFETFFPNRNRILDEGLRRFYYQSTLPQEGAFYKYHAVSYVYGIILFLRLLNAKFDSSQDAILGECVLDPPQQSNSSEDSNTHNDIDKSSKWDENQARLDYFVCTLLAMKRYESEPPYIPRLCQDEYDTDTVEQYKSTILHHLSENIPEHPCQVWSILSGFLHSLPHEHTLKFAAHYIYYEMIIHTEQSDLPPNVTPFDMAAFIIQYALERVNSVHYLCTQVDPTTLYSCTSLSNINIGPSLREHILQCLVRSAVWAQDEVDSLEEMAFMYRRVVNTVWAGDQDFITEPLQHRHLFRCFVMLRYPSLFQDTDKLHKICGQALHHLGMTVVPNHNNPTVLYFNPESRNYWKEASKAPCQHLESITKMGKYYMDRQQYDIAYGYISEAAKAGHSEALTELATMYRKGYGPLEPDNAKAVECYKRAIENDDDGFAHVSLGYMYERGYGVEQDLAQAFHHYRIASIKGQEYGSAKMGLFYETGNNVVEVDLRESLRWFLRAREQRYEYADRHINELMRMLRNATMLGNV